MMKFSSVLAVILVGFSVSGLAQQNGTFKLKPTPAEKEKKAAPINLKTPGAATPDGANAKDLRTLEHETKVSASSRSQGKKTGPSLKPIKDKPNPPINFGGNGGGKSQAQSHQVPDASKGRVREKHSHQ